MRKDPDHNSTDSAEIEALITRLERGQLRDGDAQLLARLLRLLLCLILHPDPRKTGRLNLTELEEALLKLPRARWPLGRVLAVAENSLRSKGDDEEIARGLKELKSNPRNDGLLVWINCQTVAGDLFSMNPNRDDAVVRVHAF